MSGEQIPGTLPVFDFHFDLDATDGEGSRRVIAALVRGGGYLVVTKHGSTAAIANEVFRGEPVDEYQRAVDRERHRREAAACEQALARMWSTLLGRTSGARRLPAQRAVDAVLQQHAPDTDSWDSSLICHVCDATDLDPGPWPCRTVQVIAAAYGIEVPL